VTTTAASAFGAVNATSSGMCGITLMNDQVGEVIAAVMAGKSNVTVTYLPSMIRLDAVGRMDFDYDELSEALGEEEGFVGANVLEESMSTHYGRMIHEDDRTIMFANPEDAAQYLGFDLQPVDPADVPNARPSSD
jgi:propane monooxygenase coupling protein